MKTYAEIAENNLLWAKYGLAIGEKIGQYNTVVLEAQRCIQIAEEIRDALYQAVAILQSHPRTDAPISSEQEPEGVRFGI